MISFAKLTAFLLYTPTFVSALFYFIVCISHYFSSILYVKMCTPTTFLGFLTSPFMVMTPQCSALSWVVHNSRGHLLNMWIILGNFGISFCASALIYATRRPAEEKVFLVPNPKIDSEDENTSLTKQD
jgi:hypothetical protein